MTFTPDTDRQQTRATLVARVHGGRISADLSGRRGWLLAQVALILDSYPAAVERATRSGAVNGGTGTGMEGGEPVRPEILDSETELLNDLTALVGKHRGRLGYANRVRMISREKGYICECVDPDHEHADPETGSQLCGLLSLVLDEDAWIVRCTARTCGASWPVDGTQIAAILAGQAAPVTA